MINNDLKNYIEKNILPIYEKNESGHGIEHINYVIKRSIIFSEQFNNININILYTSACYHDICHYINKDKHEILSAEFFYNDLNMKKYFSDDERILIKEAIEDHRASSKNIPRSIYGKILSTADRSIYLDDFLQRCYSYTLKHYPNFNLEEIIERSYNHTKEKYGNCGYAKSYIKDIDYDNFKNEVDEVIKDKFLFKKRFLDANKIIVRKKAL